LKKTDIDKSLLDVGDGVKDGTPVAQEFRTTMIMIRMKRIMGEVGREGNLTLPSSYAL